MFQNVANQLYNLSQVAWRMAHAACRPAALNISAPFYYSHAILESHYKEARLAFNRPKMTRKAQRGAESRFASNISATRPPPRLAA